MWAKQHCEDVQPGLILGHDLTRARHTTDDVADAWYAYNALRLADGRGASLTRSFTTEGLERVLLELVPFIREAHLQRIATHIARCPCCQTMLLVLLDGKYGARRFLCCGLTGEREFKDFQVFLTTGCMTNAPTGHLYCKACRPTRLRQENLIPQDFVLGMADEVADGVSGVRYMVRCHDPDDAAATFDAPLPRNEVRADLLESFETGLLPKRDDHGNQKAKPGWVKGHKQRTRWLKRIRACQDNQSSQRTPCKRRGVAKVRQRGGQAAAAKRKTKRSGMAAPTATIKTKRKGLARVGGRRKGARPTAACRAALEDPEPTTAQQRARPRQQRQG